MLTDRKLKIAIVSGFYSEGMGYAENCLPRALAALGHEVHLITSTYNVYGTDSAYDATYRAFLGPPQLPSGRSHVDGYEVHRLPASTVAGYVRQRGLSACVHALRPEIVHAMEIASLQTFELAPLSLVLGFRLFCETHQHMSVMKPYLKAPHGAVLRKAVYWATRTFPTWLASMQVERCYAIAPDCVEVAERFYGVPSAKLKLQSLGTDTLLFHPASDAAEGATRRALRDALGFAEEDLVCVYSGRLARDKNPLALAQAIDALADREPRFKALFIGEGVQRDDILLCRHATVVPFMKHRELAEHYRAADVACWPTQESMSMLDAAASGLPLIVSDRVGEVGRVTGNGQVYTENDPASLAGRIATYRDDALRALHGEAGRRKMVERFSWSVVARSIEADYLTALGTR